MRYLSIFNILFFFIIIFAPDLQAKEQSKVMTLTLDSVIHDGTVQTLENMYEEAMKTQVSLILIELDTPGGLLESTEEIVKLFLNSTIPIAVLVGPRGARAGSAGTFITMAAHIAAMSPGTYIGAAHPVSIGGGHSENSQSQIMNQKVESATASFISAIAKQRDRNEEWARKAVLKSDSITEDKALKMDVIDLIAKDKQDLLNQINGRKIKVLDEAYMIRFDDTPEFEEFKIDWKLDLLNTLASPNFMYILFLLMIAGIYLEATNPGLIVPGSVAGVCLILLLIASRTLPVDFIGVFLIILSLVLFVLEIFITSFGILTIGGLVSFVLGSLFLFDPTQTGVQVSLHYIFGASLSLTVIAIFVGYSIVQGIRKRQMGGIEGMIGDVGVVIHDFKKGKGKVFFQGDYWRAVSSDDIVKDDEVVIEDIEKLTLRVSKKV